MYTSVEKAKDRRLQREYNITLEERNELEKFQNYCCAICKKSHNVKGDKLQLYVDHDHKSGLIRGLICYMCNKGIAIFRDNPDKLYNAAEYFKNNPFTVLTGKDRFALPGRIGTLKRNKLLDKLRKSATGINGNEQTTKI